MMSISMSTTKIDKYVSVFNHRAAEHIRLSLELFSARSLRIDSPGRHGLSLARHL